MLRYSIRLKYIISFLVSIIPTFLYSYEYDFTVAPDGSGDYLKVQDAINAIPNLRKNRTYIFIKNGIYKEKLILPTTKENVTLIGECADSTIITYDDHAKTKNIFGESLGTSGSSGFYIFGNGFQAENITFSNTAGPVGQAVAVRIDADKVVFKNCRFLGNQDTLYPHGEESRQYYKNCYIEGTVDFIFGWSTAVFDSCHIHCLKKEGSYITAASTIQETEFGFIFRNCRITGNSDEPNYYLGRPWRPYSNVVFLHCFLDKHIIPEGWHNWGDNEKEKTARYAEYDNFGPGSNVEKRVAWARQLSSEEAKKYSLDNIFKDWNPNE